APVGSPPQPRNSASSPPHRWWLWMLAAVVLGGAAYWAFAQDATRQPGAEAAAKPSGQGIPVVATATRQGDLPVYLTGLGSVTAFNTVTVKSRVDGQLMKVAFQEGQ